MVLNEHEIDRAISILGEHAPEFAPYARFLGDWRDEVNSNSDGWAYWKAGSKCADKLGGLLQQSLDAVIRHGEHPTHQEYRAALTPIRSTATRHDLTAPELKEAEPAPDLPRPRM